MNVVYELPFGKGKQFMGDASKAMNYVVGGWQLSNTTNWSSGLPWTPSFAGCGGEEDVNVCRPNFGAGSFPMGVGSLHTPPGGQPYIQYFTPVPTITSTTGGPFLDPGKGNLGNYPRNSLHGPAGFYSDLSVAKKFSSPRDSMRRSARTSTTCSTTRCTPSARTTGPQPVSIAREARTDRSRTSKMVPTCA